METKVQHALFEEDTLRGLTSPKKYLLPKYFYNKKGSQIFQDIMAMPEYYLTDCEFQIFSDQSASICQNLIPGNTPFELIELGPGDGLKSRILLKALAKKQTDFTYLPVDISKHALNELSCNLTKEIPGISIRKKAGDFFRIMQELSAENGINKVILFLGSNIGNFLAEERDKFLSLLKAMTVSGDKALIGFDKKKDPEVILKAYDDPHGHTRNFNLNHLIRINEELNADFNIEDFAHHSSYDPVSGAVKSYLVSTKDQTVHIGHTETTIEFKKWEPIFMELSQKFNDNDIRTLAQRFGFEVQENFTDKNHFFTDSLWVKI